MIEEALSFVRFVAEKVHRRLPPGIALDSLVHAGTAGLLQASEQHKPRRHSVLQPYTKYRFQSELMIYLRSLDWVSHAIRAWGRKERSVRHSLSQQLAREAKREEIAAALNISLTEYERIMEYAHEPQLLTREALSVSSEEEWTQMQAEFFSHPSQDPLVFLRNPATLEMVREVLGTLPEQERLVMTLAYYEEMTPQEVSEVMDIPVERVAQIHKGAVAHVQRSVHVEQEATRSARG